MSQSYPHIPDAEWAVLEVLWEGGAASVRHLAERLYPKAGPSDIATVHKLLERLRGKGYVRRERREGVYAFEPVHGRDEVIGRQVESLVDKMAAGSLPALLSNLVRARRLSPAELSELYALVQSLEAGSKPKKDQR